jgi:hypothetical protein
MSKEGLIIQCIFIFLGTTARVSFVLVGDEDETKPRTFKDEKRVTLKKGSVDTYLMAVPRNIGKLSHLRYVSIKT